MGYNTIPCNPYPISTEELNKGDNDALNTRVTALEEDVSDLNSNKASKSDIATDFSDLTNYNAGDLVYYDGALYEFQVDHTAGAWETSEVIQKDLSDIVTTLKSGLTNLDSLIKARVAFYDTLSGDVIDVVASMPNNTVRFYITSNNPDHAPAGEKWGSYVIFKTNGHSSIIYFDRSIIASAYNVADTDTSITWGVHS